MLGFDLEHRDRRLENFRDIKGCFLFDLIYRGWVLIFLCSCAVIFVLFAFQGSQSIYCRGFQINLVYFEI